MVRLSTANTYSYRKGTHTHNVVILEGIQCSLFVVHYFASYHLVDVRFEEFVDLLLRPQSLDTLGSGELSGTPNCRCTVHELNRKTMIRNIIQHAM